MVSLHFTYVLPCNNNLSPKTAIIAIFSKLQKVSYTISVELDFFRVAAKFVHFSQFSYLTRQRGNGRATATASTRL